MPGTPGVREADDQKHFQSQHHTLSIPESANNNLLLSTPLLLISKRWCPGLESNQHGFYPTRSLVWRVYQFRHPGSLRAALI